MERRSLLKQLVATAAFLAVGSTPYLVSTVLTGNMVARSRYPERNMIRPPGALEDDAAFIAACIGCIWRSAPSRGPCRPPYSRRGPFLGVGQASQG